MPHKSNLISHTQANKSNHLLKLIGMGKDILESVEYRLMPLQHDLNGNISTSPVDRQPRPVYLEKFVNLVIVQVRLVRCYELTDVTFDVFVQFLLEMVLIGLLLTIETNERNYQLPVVSNTQKSSILNFTETQLLIN